jgi:hypothetical protein
MKIHKVLIFIACATILWMAFSGFVTSNFISIHRVQNGDTSIIVPLGGNAWRSGKDTTGGNISNDGIVNWTNPANEYTAFVRLSKKGSLKIALHLKVPAGKSRLSVSVLKISKQLTVTGGAEKDYDAGTWTVSDTGYIAVKIKGISKTGGAFADVSSIKLSGSAIDRHVAYVKNNDGDFFYWGRRGPSVHFNYLTPARINAEWFYNEVTVPAGNDVLHSYFMADGFTEGYFGMQVNSPTERHILFSVWSPFKTDDPTKVPTDQKIILLKKGDNVHIGEFGNEGSGGQSFLVYNWKAGNTYKFLVRAQPTDNNRTIYTAWFFATEVNKWQLIASFSRPQTTTYLKHLHSFLENFEPEEGTLTREVHFNNEWIADENGRWVELNKAKFTIDNTGLQGYRMDYAGGTTGGAFYLKNCGFFNNYTMRNTLFERPVVGKMPDVDLGRLP